MAAKEIVCAICGFKNPGTAARCVSCGARLDAGTIDPLDEEAQGRRYQQHAFTWKWAFVAFGINVVLQAIVLVLLPAVLSDVYDPQGTPGMLLSAAIWFVGGIITGLLSPGRTFYEPAVGAFMASIPTVAWLIHIDELYDIPAPLYVIGGLVGVMVTLFGALLGERIQMGMRGPAARTR